MAKRVDKETFWYEATVMRMRGKTACHRKQQGSLQATSGLDALDQLEAKAKNTWRGTIIRAKVCEVDANGEIIATTESNETSANSGCAAFSNIWRSSARYEAITSRRVASKRNR